MDKVVGKISNKIQNALDININGNINIYLGDSNISHMQKSHPEDYKKYFQEIKNILSNPDYIGINKKDNSFEFIKEYKINSEFVKVAVRVSLNKCYFARSLYVLKNNRVNNFIRNGTLKKIWLYIVFVL